jgi:GT2 family glycosyltransferase
MGHLEALTCARSLGPRILDPEDDSVTLDVVVATHNRSENLRELLEGLLRCQSPASVDWDVWIVDNNSTDSTRAVAKAFCEQNPQRFHYVFEKTQGKTYALNRGIRESSSEIVVFTDDDCVPEPNWLVNIVREFSSHPDLGILGGRIELFDSRDKPVTIRTWLDRRLLTAPAAVFYFIAGCNLAIRRNILEAVGEFDSRLGPASRSDAAEDVDFIYRALRLGAQIEYVPDVLVYHNHGRRTDLEIQSLKRKYLRGRGAFYAKHILKGDAKVLKLAYWEFRSLGLSLFKNLIARRSVAEERAVLSALLAGMKSRLTR